MFPLDYKDAYHGVQVRHERTNRIVGFLDRPDLDFRTNLLVLAVAGGVRPVQVIRPEGLDVYILVPISSYLCGVPGFTLY